MKKYCVLFNSKTHNKKGLENAKKVESKLQDAVFEYLDATKIGT